MVLPRRLTTLLLTTGVVAGLVAPGCSTSNTTPGPDGPPCAEAGIECAGCCATELGPLLETTFIEQAKKCVCDGAPFVCATPCAELCTAGAVSGECVVCLRTDANKCLDAKCTTNDCKAFRGCLQTCS